jgi:uncharacterized protein affecting Mg2+/Co2+ transport
MKKSLTAVSVLVILSFFLSSCNLTAASETQVPADQINTIAAMTVEALTTQMAPPPATATNTMEPATATPEVTATATMMIPTLNLTPLTLATNATLVPLPTNSVNNAQCNKAVFVQDVTIPDNTLLAYDQTFKKTWKIQNTGSCTWTGKYYASMVSDDPNDPVIHGEGAVPVNVNVAPGAIWQYSANLVAPKAAGTYTQYWNMVDDTGTPFTSQPWYVKVKVNKSGSGSSSGGLEFNTTVTSASCSGGDITFEGGIIKLSGDESDMDGSIDIYYYYTVNGTKRTDKLGPITFDSPGSESFSDSITYSGSYDGNETVQIYVTGSSIETGSMTAFTVDCN